MQQNAILEFFHMTKEGDETLTQKQLQTRLNASTQDVQGYRLLDGFPRPHMMDIVEQDPFALSPQMRKQEPDLDPNMGLIVGVLPHSMCNPGIDACGFCTFPHEKHNRELLHQCVHAVCKEIKLRVTRANIQGRKVDALYFGGATANLTSPDLFDELLSTLESQFNLSSAEVTLEGVPMYFLTQKRALLDRLMETKFRHRRISMGIQSFDPAIIASMGRTHFGDEEIIDKVVHQAHQRGMTVSGDIIINQPGQTCDQMIEDVRKAIQIGLDQICIYNLVLRPHIKTPWSQNPEMLAALPKGEVAYQNWLAVIEMLHTACYMQTTLSNFEHESVLEAGNGFLYEEAGFTLHEYNALGFGPRGITGFKHSGDRPGEKWINVGQSWEFSSAVHSVGPTAAPVGVIHIYEDMQDELLSHVTRCLALFEVNRPLMRYHTGLDPAVVYAKELELLEDAGLVTVNEDWIQLTTRGMFFSDSVIDILSARQEQVLKRRLIKRKQAHKEWAEENSLDWSGAGHM